ncbi:MAG: 6-carboxytetrahydropterin synthase [Nitrososphaeraceae archaeon]
MKWTISKAIDGVSYGHRVYTQNLIEEYSCDNSCKCKWLHGHNANIVVHFEGTELERGFVTDFKHSNWIKKFLDEYIDHKFIIDYNDPWFDKIINGSVAGHCDFDTKKFTTVEGLNLPRMNGSTRQLPLLPVCVPGTNVVVGHIIDINSSCVFGQEVFLEGPEREFYEGFFIVDFVPTSENLAKWVYDFVKVKMDKINVSVSKIEWSETPKTNAVFIAT